MRFRKLRFRKLKRAVKSLTQWPVHVFLFHQVSDSFDPDTMKEGDWTQTDRFKSNILKLKKRYRFVSLPEARRLMSQRVRMRHYAVLTSDDGWASLKNILPWLESQGVPVTLFLNPGYFDGSHFREKPTERYLDWEYVKALAPSVTIGSHGWEHTDALKLSADEFRESIRQSTDVLEQLPGYVPYFCYTWGSFDENTDHILTEFGLTPVLIDREANYSDITRVHRELIDGVTL